MGNIAVSNDIYNNALEYARRHDTNINVIVENFLKNIDQPSLAKPKRSVSPFQMQLLEMASRVKSEDEMNDIRRMLAQYFAKKAEDGIDKLWDKGVLNEAVLESWKTEHMRTPYKQ